MLQSAVYFFFIALPVSEACVIIIAATEPSVIHNQHLNAAFFCFFCDGNEFFRIKIKIGCFPVIDQNRALFIFIRTAYHMTAVKIMQISRHAAKPIPGKYKYCLRCIKCFILF